MAAINNSMLVANLAPSGGGAYGSSLTNCLVTRNRATTTGGGLAISWRVLNCTITANVAPSGAGIFGNTAITNSILQFNTTPEGLVRNFNSVLGIMSGFNCASPALTGPGNITADPQLLDESNLSATSPCRGAGSSLYTSGTDLHGNAWLNPPSMGAVEYYEAPITGPLAVTVAATQTNVLVNRSVLLTGHITGRAARIEWNFGDGATATNLSYLTIRSWTNAGLYPVTFTAFNDDHPAGVSAQTWIEVLPLDVPALAGEWLGTNAFRVQFTGQAGASNTIRFATNLTPPVIWHSLPTLVSTGGVVTVTDPQATNAARFYQLLVR